MANISYKMIGALCVLLGATFFSSKAVMAKLAYQYEVDALSLLTLRMVFSLPLFGSIAWWSIRNHPLSYNQWIKVIGLSLVGYYLASMFDFFGLLYVSASIERLILFTYPTIVVVLASWRYKRTITRRQWFALLATYLGVAIIFLTKSQEGPANSGSLFYTGVLMILGSAVCYAIYLVGAEQLTKKLGTVAFTSTSLSLSAIAVIVHYLIVLPTSVILSQPEPVYYWALAIAVLATFIPAFLINEGIRRVGAGNAAILASIGPVSTIILAYLFLGEQLTFVQFIGAGIVMTGVLIITFNRKSQA